MEKRTVKILVACHKDDIIIDKYPYMPIHVGKEKSIIDLKIQPDNEGENISSQNNSYCELTALYWAWKNLKDTDVVGLCHYRRYFDFVGQNRPLFPSTSYHKGDLRKLDLSVPGNVIERVSNGEVVVPKALCMECTLKHNYCEYHFGDDFRVLESVIKDTCGDLYIDAFRNVCVLGNKLHPYNMFLMCWKDFSDYCNWIFHILKIVENKLNIENYSDYQKRIYGFMAERLFNVWLVANKKHIVERSVIFIDDNYLLSDGRNVGVKKYWRFIRHVFHNNISNYHYRKTMSIK